MKGPISNPNEPLMASYGYPEEWATFSKSHQEFLKRFKNIETAITVAF
jgi:hemerythrin